MKIKTCLKNISHRRYFAPSFLLALSLTAYGWLVIKPGIYGDDPQILYAFHRYGLDGYQRALGWSRPFGAWVYTPLYILFGDHPALWQLGAILLRTLSAWLFYTLLCRAKTEWKTPALWAAAACLLYPGFSQQAHALQFSLHWAALSASLASQILMLHALEKENKKCSVSFSLLSFFLAGMGIFSTEYFIGLELLRFFLLWVFLKDKYEHAFRAALTRWMPFLGLVLSFSIWRVFTAEITYPQPLLLGDFKLDASSALNALIHRIPTDLWLSSGPAWWKPFLLQNINLDPCIYIGTGTTLSALIWLLLRYSNRRNSKENNKYALQLTATGFVIMLVSGLPLWISKTPLALSFPENRAALCLMIGACLTLSGYVSLLRHAGGILISILLGFSLIFQLDTCLRYTQAWEQMNAFFTQLTACAPGLEPGTVILYEEPFIPSYPANSLSVLLNWTYDSENHTNVLSYDMLRISERLGNSIPAFKPDLPIQHGAFQGNTSQALVITLDKDNCLHFVYSDNNNAIIPPLLQQTSAISNPDVIIPDPAKPAQPPAFINSASSIEKCFCD